MKKILFFIVYTVFGILYLWNLPRLLAWLFYKSAPVYGLLSIAGFVLLFVALYRILKKYFTPADINSTKRRIILPAIFLLLVYILPVKLRWTDYDWHFCIDNGSDENVELVINNRSCSVPAKSFDNFYQDFHCPSISIDCKGQNYHFETPGRYVFNIDALNSYYVIEHEVHTRFPFAADGFTLTDSITDTIRNRMFFHEPHGIDKWFEYPQRISVRATKDKTEWDIPKVIRSIQRISEYEEYKRNEQEMYEE